MKTKSVSTPIALALLIALSCFGVSLVTAQSDPDDFADADVIVIDAEDYEKDRKGPVAFSHFKHAKDYGISCWDCHHEYEDWENLWRPWAEVYQCVECHSTEKTEKDPPNLHKAFHLSCRGCHKEMGEKGIKTGPYRKCSGCHERRSE